jgi:AcrR family transcriptional regulator
MAGRDREFTVWYTFAMQSTGPATRARILASAYDRFYREGYGRTTMDAIAEASGVTKRTLYQHFDSKDALLGAVLAEQNARALTLVRDWAGEAAAATPAELVLTIFEGLGRWASRPRWLGSGYTRLAMELADMPGHPARRMAAGHKRAVEDWLAAELARLAVPEPDRRACELMLLMEGCTSLILIHGDPGYAVQAGQAACALIGRAAGARTAPAEP